MRYREQNNKNNRNREIFEAGPDHIGKQGWVGSSLCRARVWSFLVLGFSVFLGVARKGKGLSWKLQGCCSKPRKNAGKSQELQGSFGSGTEHSQDYSALF